MSAVRSPVVVDAPQALPPLRLVDPASIHHALDGAVGFYADEASADRVLQALLRQHGIGVVQVALLAPRDARWWRFFRRAWQWNRKAGPTASLRSDTLWKVAGAGAAGMAMLTAFVLSIEDVMPPELDVVMVLLSGLAGALAAAAVASLLVQQQPQYRQFDREVRRRLAEGQWAVLTHDLPWPRQQAVVSLFGRSSLHWCAVSSEHQRT